MFSRVTKVYDSETYDYPNQLQESITELGTTIGSGITNFAAHSLKGTNLPAPSPITPPAAQHKTLPHALGRAATNAAHAIKSTPSPGEDKLGLAMQHYAGALEKVADARVEQDIIIKSQFLVPWQTTLSTSIAVANKARQAVRHSRLELDAAKQTLVHTLLISPGPLLNKYQPLGSRQQVQLSRRQLASMSRMQRTISSRRRRLLSVWWRRSLTM